MISVVKKVIIFLAFGFNLGLGVNNKVDIIAFSYNRPLQLEALIYSLKSYTKGINSFKVIYRSDLEFENAYTKLKKVYTSINFYKQNTINDFKPKFLKALKEGTACHVMLVVDDIIVTDYIDFTRCTKALDMNSNYYAFYLGLGKNITFNYMVKQDCKQPVFSHVDKDIIKWQFNNGGIVWRYPNQVHFSIYKKQEVKNTFKKMNFYSPNSLESNWNRLADSVSYKNGLCFSHSKGLSIPLNRVQNEVPNNNMNSHSIKDLLIRFNEGLRLDIRPLHKISTGYTHLDYEVRFVKR